MDNIKWLIDEYKGIKKAKKHNIPKQKNNVGTVQIIDEPKFVVETKPPKTLKTTDEHLNLQQKEENLTHISANEDTEMPLDNTQKLPEVSLAELEELCDCDDKEELMSIIEIINMDDQNQFEDALNNTVNEDDLQIDLKRKQESEKQLHELLLEKKHEFIEINKQKINISQKPPCNCKKKMQKIVKNNITPELNDNITLRNIDKEKLVSKSYDDEIINIGK